MKKVLRTFALALREAQNWDKSPLIGPAAFLNAPEKQGLSEALREMVAVADTEEWEGKKQAWTGILDNEFSQARKIQLESTGLKHREVEQAVVATFLHSQPLGQNARTHDLLALLGSARPDKIELEKGLTRWAQTSNWLDDQYTGLDSGKTPGTWRLGNRPNLVQMHASAARGLSDDMIRARLIDEIGKVKTLVANASAAGVRVHTLPGHPRNVEDDGAFHFVILPPTSASESGKPSAEARRFLDETTEANRPRVYRNSVLLLAPSKDGLELALAQVRDFLAWEAVREEVKKQQKDGSVDPARAQTLQMNIDRSRGRITDTIRQAWCIVVTVSEKDEVQAFKLAITDEPHFNLIKNDRRSRVQDTAVTAEALLPEGPYNLWRSGETSRRVKDLAGAFAQLPHLPKMLKAGAILDTLANGCEQGTFVLKLTRPDNTFRAWWLARPDENALKDPALELVLPEAAELDSLQPELLAYQRLPGLWPVEEMTVQAVVDYFSGATVAQVERNGYKEPICIPKVGAEAVFKAVEGAVQMGALWLRSGPASLLDEEVPAGVLNAAARLAAPPSPVPAAAILPENLPEAWKEGQSSGLSIATSLSFKQGKTLPWKTVQDAITGALHARFIGLAEGSRDWPCDFPSAAAVRFRVEAGGGVRGPRDEGGTTAKVFRGRAELDAAQIQELGDKVPALMAIRNRRGVPIHVHVQIEMGDGKAVPPKEAVQEANALLGEVKDELQLG